MRELGRFLIHLPFLAAQNITMSVKGSLGIGFHQLRIIMLKKFLPKEDKFFSLFDEISVHLVQSAHELMKCLRNPSLIAEKASLIREIEHKADAVTHATLERLHDTFITPFDRNDIYGIIQGLDDIIDLVHAVSERLVIYHLTQVPAITVQLAEKSQEAMIQVQKAISCLRNIRKADSLRGICADIHRIENESDVLFRESIAKLFREENDMKTLISLKDVNEIMETIADRCEHLASLIESLILEYA